MNEDTCTVLHYNLFFAEYFVCGYLKVDGVSEISNSTWKVGAQNFCA